MTRPGADIFLPLLLLQIPQKTLARFGLAQKDWEELLRALLAIDVQAAPAADALISLRDFCRVFRVARNLFGHARFLEGYVEDIRAWHFGAVGLAMEAAPTLDDSLDLWVENAALLAPMLAIVPRENAGTRTFEVRLTTDLGDITETYMELILLLTVALLRGIAGGRLHAELSFAHERFPGADFYHEAFGIEPVFGHRHYALVLPRSETARANDHHAPLLLRDALEGIRALRETARHRERLAFQVRRYLALSADDGLFPGFDEAALHFSMSARTFARHLQEEGVTFRDLRTAVQVDLARRLLRRPALSLRAVAERAGFPSPEAFARAFEAACARSPEAYRAGLRRDGAPALPD